MFLQYLKERNFTSVDHVYHARLQLCSADLDPSYRDFTTTCRPIINGLPLPRLYQIHMQTSKGRPTTRNIFTVRGTDHAEILHRFILCLLHIGFLLSSFSILKMDAKCSSETSVDFRRNTQCYVLILEFTLNHIFTVSWQNVYCTKFALVSYLTVFCRIYGRLVYSYIVADSFRSSSVCPASPSINLVFVNFII
jgi:hypothetical protein